ncbi:hypothetical protein CKM354_001043600 [Cercospora kikuchii]|uniref:Wings apart-like protein C-terminal domain-containing protein n=1 Tax=Cercospora kikuchii TaxID=84275 RepID=A0A9P3FJQ8_9PEZI|nr:uncharacterized protein CKM354_001043600 [Cercospora kikuchii]GIZ47342.1 hypothetical protein CKM354_001043600 [Cercospora kikuchii]
MATASTITHARRRKQTTYGKASRNANAWNVSGFDDDADELASVANVVSHPKVVIQRIQSPVKSPPTERPRATVKETYRVEKQERDRGRLPALAKTRKNKQDDWDVPSSDEEVGNSFTRHAPPKRTARPRIVNVVEEREAPLAPWEKQTVSADMSKNTVLGQKAKLAQTRPQAASHSPPQEDEVELQNDTPQSSALPSPQKLVSPGGGSAIERLKARRANQKRTDQSSTDSNPKPPKRIKSQDAPEPEDQDMQDILKCEVPARVKLNPMKDDGDIYAFPQSSADDVVLSKGKTGSRKQIQQSNRRGKLTSLARASPRAMTSAPARLTEMLLNDTDTTADSSRSPTDSLSRPSTPQKLAGSDPLAKKPTKTPKQDQMWKDLLSDEAPSSSPSVLPMQQLTLQSTRRTAPSRPAAPRLLAKSSSDIGPPRQRTRLVDQLRASAPDSEMEDSSSDEDESDDDDMDTSSDGHGDDDIANSQSQSQSQTTVAFDSGPKITYSRMRSYLPEDSFEDGLMLSLPERSTPVVSRKSQKSNSASQQSTFDFPDSDDDDDGGRLRTVHELRAAGGNQRFMDETSGLLDDIAVHDNSARGRRRSALIELTKKLMGSKAFVEKFFRQGFEQKLLAEFNGPSDDIANFVLAVASAALLRDDSPDHVAQSCKENNAVVWLTKLLENDSDAKKLVKDRKYNMSKSAQTLFVDFVDKLSLHDTFWDELKPVLITPRIVALKALDSLVGKLRRSGDRSELAGRHELSAILFSQHELTAVRRDEAPLGVSLSVSALERLASLGAPVAWPTEVLQRLGELLVMPVLGSESLKHLRFLALRLCLSLTHDNIRGCKQLAKFPLVRCLFSAIGNGFRNLESQVQAIDLDLLVLEMGVMVNMTEHAEAARQSAAASDTQPLLIELVHAFTIGHKRLSEAETEEETAANVAYGYLAVVLAILCRNRDAKSIIADNLPRKNLDNLIEAVDEFIEHHRRVDKLTFGGEESGDVWSAFTEKLKGVLDRLKAAAQ